MSVKYQDNSVQISKLLDDSIHESLKEIGQEAVEFTAQYAPRKTGALAESYDYEINKNEVVVGSPLSYAPEAEYGRNAQPHLRPAVLSGLNNLSGKISLKMRS